MKKINRNIPSTTSTPEDTPTKELKFKNIPLKIRIPASPPNKRKIKDQQDEPKPKKQFISTQAAAPLKRIPKINQRRSDTTEYIQNEQTQSKINDEILEETTNQLTKEIADEVTNEMKEEQRKETMKSYSQAKGTNVNHQTMKTKEVPKPKTSVPNIQQKQEERNLKNQTARKLLQKAKRILSPKTPMDEDPLPLSWRTPITPIRKPSRPQLITQQFQQTREDLNYYYKNQRKNTEEQHLEYLKKFDEIKENLNLLNNIASFQADQHLQNRRSTRINLADWIDKYFQIMYPFHNHDPFVPGFSNQCDLCQKQEAVLLNLIES